MDDPLGFFLTWVTYGTWLPGDARGWVEHRRGWHLPDPMREAEAEALMTEDACRLTLEQRNAVEQQMAETCRHRRWHLHAVNCRTNHVHIVVSAKMTPPKKIRADLKAWATRCLKENFDHQRENWWAERGSIRHLNNEPSLEASDNLCVGRTRPETRSVSEGVGERASSLAHASGYFYSSA